MTDWLAGAIIIEEEADAWDACTVLINDYVGGDETYNVVLRGCENGGQPPDEVLIQGLSKNQPPDEAFCSRKAQESGWTQQRLFLQTDNRFRRVMTYNRDAERWTVYLTSDQEERVAEESLCPT